MNPLRTRPTRNDRRIDWQLAAINRILKGTTFGLRCLLLGLKDETPYRNRLPTNLEQLAFAIKGWLRLELIDDPVLMRWRRLFGTTTGTKTGRRRGEFEGLPKSWKSRVLFTVFPDAKKAQVFVDRCPLARWSGKTGCPLLAGLPAQGGPFVLLQIHDVTLEGDQTLADLLETFLKERSQLFTLLAAERPIFPWEGPDG